MPWAASHCRPFLRTRVEVEWATLESVDWFDNHRRFLEPIGNILPAKAEAEYLFLSRRSAMSVGL